MKETLDNKQTLFNKVADAVSKAADVSLEKINPETTFQSLGLDSLDALALISDMEEEFKIKIPNQELLKIRTVGQAVESLQKRIG